MTDFRRVTADFSVAPQLAPQDMAAAAQAGFVRVINNRPDGEESGQPTGAAMEVAAHAAGLEYLAIPIRGGPNREQALAQAKACEGAGGPVLAFCRSGTRSITTWGAGEALSGALPPGEVKALAAQAGYDLSGLFG